jgi:hypothetical protein
MRESPNQVLFNLADDVRRLGEEIVREREALMAVIYEHATPKLLRALEAYNARSSVSRHNGECRMLH